MHPEYQYIASTPDRLIGEDAVLEIKCPFSAFNKHITPETVSYLYLCEKTGQLLLQNTHDYYHQVQGQLLCTQRQRAYFCIYTITDIVIIIIERDELFISEMLMKLTVFYNEYYKEQYLNRHLYNVKI